MLQMEQEKQQMAVFAKKQQLEYQEALQALQKKIGVIDEMQVENLKIHQLNVTLTGELEDYRQQTKTLLANISQRDEELARLQEARSRTFGSDVSVSGIIYCRKMRVVYTLVKFYIALLLYSTIATLLPIIPHTICFYKIFRNSRAYVYIVLNNSLEFIAYPFTLSYFSPLSVPFFNFALSISMSTPCFLLLPLLLSFPSISSINLLFPHTLPPEGSTRVGVHETEMRCLA